jgi:hypothetical protein
MATQVRKEYFAEMRIQVRKTSPKWEPKLEFFAQIVAKVKNPSPKWKLKLGILGLNETKLGILRPNRKPI